jgi:hypothetical protein
MFVNRIGCRFESCPALLSHLPGLVAAAGIAPFASGHGAMFFLSRRGGRISIGEVADRRGVFCHYLAKELSHAC